MLHWGLYVLLPIIPVLLVTTRLTISHGLFSPLWVFLIIFAEFGSALLNSTSPVPRRKRRCCPRPNWKRAQRFRRRALPYWLVRRCRRRPSNRLPRMDGTFFPSPAFNKHKRWRRRRERARTFFSRRKLEEFLSG